MWPPFKIFQLQKLSFGVTAGLTAIYPTEIKSNSSADGGLADIRIKLLGANIHLEQMDLSALQN